jgi:serine/threonine protein kinase
MPPEGHCPEEVQLKSLLSGVLSLDSQADLNAHLDTCAACQQKLETVSAQDDASLVLARRLAQGRLPLEPKLQAALDALKAMPAGEESASQPEDVNDLALDFLGPADQPGQLGRIGHYAVLEVVGRGGMGVVLKAFDEQLHRVVAVKVMAAQLAANPTARKRFTREAQATAAIRDEQVISIHAVGETKRLPYLVMDYIQGISLQDRLDQTGPMAIEQVVRIGLQIARGLAAAHAQGLIHRDIKPGNILLENGVERVKITDFGLALALDDASLTQSGVIAGTPHYMAPEQARVEVVDHRADLFSLGSLLYAMCTGHPPFRANGSLAVLKRVCDDTPRPIQQINPETPDWLIAVIGTLHAKDPGKRFQSAAEVADLLSLHLAGTQRFSKTPMPQASEAVSIPPRRANPRSRRWLLATVPALLLVCGLGLSEGTGVTHVVPTVIRIITGEGTLVVEVDDPAVKVDIDGVRGLVISGAGLHELRLRPGSYHVQAIKDGKAFQSEQVTLSRGANQLVRIHWEESQALARPLSTEEKQEQARQQIAEADQHFKLGEPLRTKDPRQAEFHYRKATDLYGKLVQDIPEVTSYQRKLEVYRWHLSSALNLQAARLVQRRSRISDTDKQRALTAAKEAVALLPFERGYWTNLSLAHYRAGDWEAAKNALETTEPILLTTADNYEVDYGRFVLAIVHWQRGDKERARRCYDQAAEWMDKYRSTDSPLRAIRAEASEVLGVPKSP